MQQRETQVKELINKGHCKITLLHALYVISRATTLTNAQLNFRVKRGKAEMESIFVKGMSTISQ